MMPRIAGVTPRKPHRIVVGDTWQPQKRVARTTERTLTFAQDQRIGYRTPDGKEHRCTRGSWRDWLCMYGCVRLASPCDIEQVMAEVVIDQVALAAAAKKRRRPSTWAPSALDADMAGAFNYWGAYARYRDGVDYSQNYI